MKIEYKVIRTYKPTIDGWKPVFGIKKITNNGWVMPSFEMELAPTFDTEKQAQDMVDFLKGGAS